MKEVHITVDKNNHIRVVLYVFGVAIDVAGLMANGHRERLRFYSDLCVLLLKLIQSKRPVCLTACQTIVLKPISRRLRSLILLFVL